MGTMLPTIRFASGIADRLGQTIGRFPPEQYAMLGVRLDTPFRIEEVRIMPPQGGNAGHTHVQLNAPFIEHILNIDWLPRGLYIGGIVHTHPWGCTRLSGGREGSGQGDIPSMRAALERAQRHGMTGARWTNFLAPIITVEPTTWAPTFTGWIVRLDHPSPIPAEILFEEPAPPPSPERTIRHEPFRPVPCSTPRKASNLAQRAKRRSPSRRLP